MLLFFESLPIIGLLLYELHELVPGYKPIGHQHEEDSKCFSHLGVI